MRLPRYPEYRDSGIDWLGPVPQQWDVYPLKRDLEFITSGSRGWAEHYSDDGALFIRIGNLTRDSIHLDLSDIQRVAVPEGAEGERTRVREGDVLFSITAYLGSVAVVPAGLERAFVSQHVALARLRPKRVLPSWAALVAASRVGKTFLETRGYGGTKVQLSLDDVAEMVLPVPPMVEQVAITAFLDHQTAKIDGLIAEQEKLIALLAEKRQATISHAVTRGLNPQAPMKDSGVPWLGEVPAHWAVKRMKQLVVEGIAGPYGSSLTKDMYTSQGYRVYGQQQVIPGDFSVGDYYISEEKFAEMSRYVVAEGDLLVSVMGTIGRAAVVPADAEPGIINPRLVLYRVNRELVQPNYMQLFLSAPSSQRYFALAAQGTTMEGLNMSSIGALWVAVPPLHEQGDILAAVQAETCRLSAATHEVETAVALLKERRSALIAAAVTGQIDVRGFAAA